MLCTFVWYQWYLVLNYVFTFTIFPLYEGNYQLALVFPTNFVLFGVSYVILNFTIPFQELLKSYLQSYQNLVPLLLCWPLAMLSYLTWVSSVGWGLQMIASLHQILQALGVWVQFKVVSWQLYRLILENTWPGSLVCLGAYWLASVFFDIACSLSWFLIWKCY